MASSVNALNFHPGTGGTKAPTQGLEHTFYRDIFVPLLNARNHDGSPTKTGWDLSLEAFMQDHLKLKNSRGEPLGWADLWLMMGINPMEATLQNILDRPDDFRFLGGEMIREFIIQGFQQFEQIAWYQQLCVSTGDQANAMTIHQPWLKYQNVAPQQVTQGETLPLGRMAFGDKSIRLTTKGTFIEWTDQLKYSSPLSLMAVHFAEVAAVVIVQENDHCIWTMVNGDQAILGSNADSCAVVGVVNPTNGATFDDDYVRVWSRGSALHMRWAFLITSEAGSIATYKVPEFKPQRGVLGGATVEIDSKNRIVPSRMPHFVSGLMNDKWRMLVDNLRTMRHLQLWPLKVEQARYPEKLVDGVGISTCTGYESIRREGRIIIAEDKTVEQAPFPSFMAPPPIQFTPPGA